MRPQQQPPAAPAAAGAATHLPTRHFANSLLAQQVLPLCAGLLEACRVEAQVINAATPAAAPQHGSVDPRPAPGTAAGRLRWVGSNQTPACSSGRPHPSTQLSTFSDSHLQGVPHLQARCSRPPSCSTSPTCTCPPMWPSTGGRLATARATCCSLRSACCRCWHPLPRCSRAT